MGWTTISPWRPIAGSGQNITVGASSTQAANAIGDNAQAIQISTTGTCHVAIGADPTAVGTDMLVKSTDDPLIVRVAPGEKVAVIQDGSSTGTCNIVEMTH